MEEKGPAALPLWKKKCPMSVGRKNQLGVAHGAVAANMTFPVQTPKGFSFGSSQSCQ